MVDSDQKVDLRGDGRIILYKREGLKNPVWQVRIRVPNSKGYKVVSTKMADQRSAERFAMDLYDELFIHVKQGGSIRTKTFRQVFDEWALATQTMGQTRQGGKWDGTVERVRKTALEFFGPKRIDAINAADFSEYWVWRKDHFPRKKPSNGTLRRERTSLIPLFKFAVSRGYISAVPNTEPPKAKLERRPTFTLEEWRQIYTTARLWVEEGKKVATGRDRFVSQHYFLILANTGMRVGELRNLRWMDLRTVKVDGGSRLIGYVKGKTGSREVVFQEGADTYVKRLYDMRVTELGDKPPSSGLVICHKDGSPIATMKRSFQSLLKRANIPEVRDGMARTIYSLRHFYATQRPSHETSPFLLAKQMGTSVEMLEKFYGQTVTSSLAAEISRGNQSAAPAATNDYPFE
jgi:integrase